MTIPILKCSICKHLVEKITKEGKIICKAFPNGIPDKILDGRVIHDRIVGGQKGKYIYEPKSEKWQK